MKKVKTIFGLTLAFMGLLSLGLYVTSKVNNSVNNLHDEQKLPVPPQDPDDYDLL